MRLNRPSLVYPPGGYGVACLPLGKVKQEKEIMLARSRDSSAAAPTRQGLPDHRRPYPLNIACALDVELPPEEKLPPLFVPADEAVMDAALAQARRALRGR
jgi:hypothetical protein